MSRSSAIVATLMFRISATARCASGTRAGNASAATADCSEIIATLWPSES